MIPTQPNEFTIAGTSFRQMPLKLKPALKAEAIIAEAILPAAAAGAAGGGFVAGALAGLERLPDLVDLFAGVSKVLWESKWVDLAPFADLVFERKNALLLAWLAACIEWQFADFFDGTGLPLLEAVGSRFTSLLGSTGGSGESQPATT